MDEDRLVYAIHFGDEDEESSSGHSDLDEEYERYRPGPVCISPTKLVEISANGVSLVENLRSNPKKTKRKRKKKKKSGKVEEIEPTVVLPIERLVVEAEFQTTKNKSKHVMIGQKFSPSVKNAFDALAFDEETTVYVSDEETISGNSDSTMKKSVDNITQKPDKEKVSDSKKKKRHKRKKKSEKVDEIEPIAMFTRERPFVEENFQTTKTKSKQVQMTQTITPSVKNSFDALDFDRDTSLYVSDVEDVEESIEELKIENEKSKIEPSTDMEPEGKTTKNRYKKRQNLKTTNKINITHLLKLPPIYNINNYNNHGIYDSVDELLNSSAIKNMFLIDDILEYPVWISEELPENILKHINFLQYLNCEEGVKFQTTKTKSKQVQMDQPFTPSVKNSFDALAFDRDTSIYVSDVEDVQELIEEELKIENEKSKIEPSADMELEGPHRDILTRNCPRDCVFCYYEEEDRYLEEQRRLWDEERRYSEFLHGSSKNSTNNRKYICIFLILGVIYFFYKKTTAPPPPPPTPLKLVTETITKFSSATFLTIKHFYDNFINLI